VHFSETAARAEGLEPQQHQLMLAVRSLDGDEGPTVGELADYLLVRHHSAVGLIDRLAERGFVERARGADDRRHVRIRLTPEGERKLMRLSEAHRAELRESGPELVRALRELLRQLGAGDGEAGRS
jgi:DNA-binding MarR family transcriptional regulator